MDKTIKEIANEFNLSKSAIRKYLTTDFRKKYVVSYSNRLFIRDDGLKILRKKLSKNNVYEPHREESAHLNELPNAVFIEQLRNKDNQIQNLQKLLDQSQQLQLMAEKKIAALEAPKETETPSQPAKSETTSETVTEDTKKEPRSQKKGFWHRIFK